jgi:sugar-phosphatase
MLARLIIFDMDGVLIDSEPWWNVALQIGFRTVGLEMTNEMCEETMGARLNEVVDYRVRKHNLDASLSMKIEKRIEDEIIHLVRTKAGILDGVRETIDQLKTDNYRLAIASSSPHRLINAVIEKLNYQNDFEAVFSAQDDAMGKPHPSVYLRCAKSIGVPPSDCLVFEDSINGMVAAKAAGMKVIVIPDSKMQELPEWGLADKKLKTLLEFSTRIITEL